MIGKVRLKKCLKAGRTVWDIGTVLAHPNIPTIILLEVKRKTGSVEVLEYLPDPIKVTAPAPADVLKETTSITSTVKTSNQVSKPTKLVKEPKKVVKEPKKAKASKNTKKPVAKKPSKKLTKNTLVKRAAK